MIAGAEADFGPVVIVGSPANVQARWLHLNFSGGTSVGFYGGDWAPAAAAITNATHLVHWVYDAPNKQSSLYIDGVLVGGGAHTHVFSGVSDIATTGAAGSLGFGPPKFGPGGNTSPTNDGVLDEVRLATPGDARRRLDRDRGGDANQVRRSELVLRRRHRAATALIYCAISESELGPRAQMRSN